MISLLRTVLILFLILTIAPAKSQTKIGVFDSHLDIGAPKNKGFAYYQEEDQTYLIGGSGKNMWLNEDQFQYLWTTVQGDFILRAEFEFMGKGIDPHRKVGWIVKNDLNSETPHVNASTHGDGLTSLQYRKTIGGDTEELVSKNTAPEVIQLERRGDVFIMSTAKFGEPFVEVQLENMPVKNQVFVGLYVCSHNADIVEVAKFRNVRIIQPAAPDFQPYRDYLGSRLEVMDVSTGHRKVLFTTTNSIQAPNWTPDGTQLIYNSEGRLFNYHLPDRSISPMNTGFAVNNNNDHVLSFDGSLMGLSNHNPADNNNSTLYYLPSEGNSSPVVVTKPGLGASYLHGWSPDNTQMLFTGQRNGQYDIYSVDVKTGLEKQLTNLKTLDDGPEYSPDGKHIFFNSVRTGKMKLWRMDPDGRNQAQLTFDEYNDWFPHVSPDGKWIAFISFPKDIDPSDHPFYKHCLLRIMPFEGGTPRIIGYIYGGQGSINVPSWSPDSKSISFVTNSKL
jgi:Tol biopolymer transport system component